MHCQGMFSRGVRRLWWWRDAKHCLVVCETQKETGKSSNSACTVSEPNSSHAESYWELRDVRSIMQLKAL
jgi:hypothetical protein